MKLEFRAPGWPSVHAHASEATTTQITTVVGESSFTWDRWTIPTLLLSSQAGLLLIQGLKLQKLFDNAHLHIEDDVLEGDHLGPFLLVKADYRPYHMPPKLTNVMLARIFDPLPDPIKIDDAIGAIIQVALAP